MRFAEVMLAVLFAPLLSAQFGEVPLRVTPPMVEVDSGTTRLLVNGTGFRPGWQVLWNGAPRTTEFLDQYSLRVTLEETDTLMPSLAFLSVADAASSPVRAPLPIFVHVRVFNNDLVYDAVRERFWVAVSAFDKRHGTSIALLNPQTGVVERYIPMAVEPQRLALSDDSSVLYVSTPGRIYRLDTSSLQFDLDFPIPPSDIGSLPPEAYVMAVAPGQRDVLVASIRAPFVSPGFRGAIVFESGIPRPTELPPRDGPVFLYGWTSDGQLIGADFRNVYIVDVTPMGLEYAQATEIPLGFYGCSFAQSLLYCSTGAVVDPLRGSYIGEYPAAGSVAALPDQDRIVFIDDGYQTHTPPFYYKLQVFELATKRHVFSSLVPLLTSSVGNTPPVRWGLDGLAWRSSDFGQPSDRLVFFSVSSLEAAASQLRAPLRYTVPRAR